MKKSLIRLNSREQEFLKAVMEHDQNSHKKKLKAKVILLRSMNKDITTIKNETKLSKRTIINYTNEYLNNRDMFFVRKYNKSELAKHTSIIKSEFKENPPITYSEATLRIEKLTGIKRSETQVRKFLMNNGIYTDKTRKIKFYIKQKLKAGTYYQPK